MAEKSKIVRVIELNANAKHLQEALSTLRKSFSGMTLPQDLEKTFAKLESSISSVVRKTEKGIIPREDFQDTEKELTKVKNGFDALSSSVENLKEASDKRLLSMLPKDAVQKLNAAKKAYDTYSATLTTVVKAEQDLEKAERKRKEAEDTAGSAFRSASAYKGKVTAAKEQLVKYEEITNALKEQEEATKELEKATKELEKAKKSGMGEKGLASRRARVEEATAKKATADAKVGGFSTKDIKDQADATEKVRVATEKYEIAQRAAEDATKAKTSAEVTAQSAATNLANVQKKSAENAEEQAKALATLKSALEAVNPKFKNIVVEGKTTTEQLANLREIVDGLTDDELANLKRQLGKVDTTFDTVEDGLESLKNGLQQTKQAVKESDEAFAQQQAFENKIKQFLGLSGAAQVLRSALRDAMQTITELDATMGEMAVVTDLGVGDYWDQLPEYTKRANELGLAINDVYKADTLFYQQGLKTNEVIAISTETMKMAKIAGLDTAEATDRMTAALRGFNMELNEVSAQKISDVYSELAAITAADVDEISTAMTKTASIASSAGMEFETTAAFLSQIIETTRESAETAGTAMKTVIARFQELKKSPKEIGEIDGEIVDANAIETALRSVGVELRDASGQFRELDEVFLELSSKWDALDKNTQRYIATIAAGSRQQSRFIAMMSDYSRTAELVSAANNSAGASARQFQKTTETLEFKINQLANAWHEFTMGIVNSDLVKMGVDILTKFLTIINKATGALDSVAGSVIKLSSIIGIFKLGSKLFTKFMSPLKKFFIDVVQEVHKAGEDSGKAYYEGVQKGTQQAQNSNSTNIGRMEQSAREQTGFNVSNIIGQVSGLGNITAGIKGIKTGNQELKKISPSQVQKIKEKAVKSAKTIDQNRTAAKKAQNDLKAELLARKAMREKGIKPEPLQEKQWRTEANKKYEIDHNNIRDLDIYNDKVNKVAKSWDSVNTGIVAAGKSVTALGMGFSVLGAILSELGLEEIGETMSEWSNWITLLGLGVAAFGSIMSGVSAALVSWGVKVQAAWWWALLIVAAIVAIVAGIAIIANHLAEISPEGKLKNTEEAAQRASEAADEATESYNNLVDALEKLDGKYKALEDLTKGTKEWKLAVQEINTAVLDLIDKYPKLAKFVENREGLLALNASTEEMDAIIQDELNKKVLAQNNAVLANIAVAQAQNDVAYSHLEDVQDIMDTSNVGSAYAHTMGGTLGVGLTSSSIIGGVIGSAIAPGLGTAIGASIGALVGGTAGLFGGMAAGEYAEEHAIKNNISKKHVVEELAKAMASGDVISKSDIADKLIGLDYAQEEAQEMAVELFNNSEELRKFGDSLLQVEQQQAAAFDAIASSAQAMANTIGMSIEEIAQSLVLADGELAKSFYDRKMTEIEDITFEDKGWEENEEVQAAIRKQYGAGAHIDKDGKVTYQLNGANKEVNLTEAEVKNLIATQYATEQTKKSIEYSDEAINDLGKTLGEDTAKALYSKSEGRGLTQADLKIIQKVIDKGDYQSMWNSLSPEAQQAYGNNIDNLIKDLQDAAFFADDAFEKAGDAVEGFMSADMAQAYSEKLDEIAKMAGGEEAKETIKTITRELIASVANEDKKQEIQSRINVTDWSNQESLLSLQLDLEKQYGYTRDEAQSYIEVLSQAAYATSSLTTTVEVFGEVWKASEKINQSMVKLTHLQWEYNKALTENSDKISGITSEIIAEYKNQADLAEKKYNASNDDLAKLYAQGGTLYKEDLREYVKLGKYGIEIDQFSLNEAIAAKRISQEEADTWIEQLTQAYETSQEALEEMQNSVESIEEMEEEGKNAYNELWDMAEEVISGQLQKQIELQQENIDATEKANSTLIDKIQEQIDQTRADREKEETEKNLAELREKYSYLSMNTSGANDLELLNLEKEIASAEQNYQDTLIDQAIQNLTDTNEKAIEQRTTQIALAQSQLDAYLLSNQFQAEIDTQLSELLAGGANWENTPLGQSLKAEFTNGMNDAQTVAWAETIGQNVCLANGWEGNEWSTVTKDIKTQISQLVKAIGGQYDKEGNLIPGTSLAEQLTSLSSGYKVHDQAVALEKEGFDVTKAGMAYNADEKQWEIADGYTQQQVESNLNNFTNFSGTDSSEDIGSLQKQLDDSDISYLNEQDFFETYSEQIASQGYVTIDDKSYKSYAEYLKSLHKSKGGVSGADNIEDYSFSENDGAIGAWFGDDWDEFNDEENAWFNLYLYSGSDTYKDTRVKTGKKFGDSQRLETLWNNTHTDSMKESGQRVVLYGGSLYANGQASGGNWYKIMDQGADYTSTNIEDQPNNAIQFAKDYIEAMNKKKKTGGGGGGGANGVNAKTTVGVYKTGGLADFTGLAWLDGTPSKPEYILNAAQTERFFSLVDVLEGIRTGENNTSSSGDNYFDIEIKVESLQNDYDVEQVANKIRSMIYEDAMYRNVNAINHIR